MNYRFSFVDASGAVISAFSMNAGCEEDACEIANDLLASSHFPFVEIWAGDRMIYCIARQQAEHSIPT